jgi:hypothetical protein
MRLSLELESRLHDEETTAVLDDGAPFAVLTRAADVEEN